MYHKFTYLIKSLEGKGKGLKFVRPTTTTLQTLPTQRTFVQQLTLPKVVLIYYKQWQTEGNESSIQTIVPLARASRMVVPTII